ncbi:MAG: hypothetical protein Q9160_006954 [Pyrenula sp. 1 TL-2023]
MRHSPLLIYWALLVALTQAVPLSFARSISRYGNLLYAPSSASAIPHPDGSAHSSEFMRRPSAAVSPKFEASTVVSIKSRGESKRAETPPTPSTVSTHILLPLQPRITPTLSVAGVLLICLGTAYALIGVKIRWILIPVGIFFLIDIAVAVLLAYVANPPIGDGLQGAYFGAILGSGLILGGASWFFKEITEGLICLLGGYCFSMWILVLSSGSSIHDSTARAIFIVVISVAAYALWFSRYTRDYGLVACSSFAGATALALGIDCFSKAGMKEFWVYIWALNAKIFPFGTETYSLTKGLRIEIAVIILGAFAGAMSQMRLWAVLQERQRHGHKGFLVPRSHTHLFGRESTSKAGHTKPQRFASWRILLGSRRRRGGRFPLDIEESFDNRLPPRIADSHLSRSVAEELEMRFFSAFTLPPIGESIRGSSIPKQSAHTSEHEENTSSQTIPISQSQVEETSMASQLQPASGSNSTVPVVDCRTGHSAGAGSSNVSVKRKPLPPGAVRTISSQTLPLSSPQSEGSSDQDSQSVYVTPESDREGFVEPSPSSNIEGAGFGASASQTSKTTHESNAFASEGLLSERPSEEGGEQDYERIRRKRSRMASSRNHLLREPKGRRLKGPETPSSEQCLLNDEQASRTEIRGTLNGDETLSVSTSDAQGDEEEASTLPRSIPPRSRKRPVAISSEVMRTSIDENSETDFDSLNGSQSSLSARHARPSSQLPNSRRKRHTLSTLEEGSISASEKLRRLRESSNSLLSSNDSASNYSRPTSFEHESLRFNSETGSWNYPSNMAGEVSSPSRRSSMDAVHAQPGYTYPYEHGPVITRQPGRRSFTDPERRAELMANWRESVRQENAIRNTELETADSRRLEMLMTKHQDRLSQLQKEAAAIRREQAYDQVMRTEEMQTAHREAMQKLQATANTRL